MSFLLNAQGLSKSFGTRSLFRNISLSVRERERIGLIGANGIGKSTLLRIIAGLETADAGSIGARRGLRVAYVPQSDDLPPQETLRSLILSAMPAAAGSTEARAMEAGAVAARLGLERLDEPVAGLSAGVRKRASIALAILSEPDLVLLDEPTNHLDLDGVLWLERQIASLPSASISVTHDRYFLEKAATRIVELDRAYPDGHLSVNGSYSTFLTEREARLAAQQQQEESMAIRARREIEWLRSTPQARTTKAAHRIEDAHKLLSDLADLRDRNRASDTAGIDFAGTGRRSRELVTLTDAVLKADDAVIVSGLNLSLAPGQKLGIVGPNASGKSYLAKAIAQEAPLASGLSRAAAGLAVAYVEQERPLQDPKQSLREALSPNGDTVIYQGRPMHVAAWAKRFLFDRAELERPVGTLSGGERARLSLAQQMVRACDLLVLDEPTTDLDIATLDVLEESLLEFPGAVVIVTQDRYLLDSACTLILALDGRGGHAFLADTAQWSVWRSQEASATAAAPLMPSAAKPVRAPRLTTAERRELQSIEQDISRVEDQIQALERDLERPEVVTDASKLQHIWEELPRRKERLAALYDRWQELEDRKEAAGRPRD
jgi:ATP-binding cassette subfamily F protein uup